MSRSIRVCLLLIFTCIASVTQAGSYPGLIVQRIWAADGFVAVLFGTGSNPNSLAACPAAYLYSTDKSVLATLLAAKAQGTSVTVYEGSGGAPLPNIIDSTVPNVWARPIAIVSID